MMRGVRWYSARVGVAALVAKFPTGTLRATRWDDAGKVVASSQWDSTTTDDTVDVTDLAIGQLITP